MGESPWSYTAVRRRERERERRSSHVDLLEGDAASRRLYKSEGLHHLADVGEDFIRRPLAVNL